MLVQSLHKADSLGLEQRNQHIKFPRRCCVYIKAKVRSLCKHCTASISPSNNPKWHEVCGIFFFFKQFNFRFGPFGFFRFSIGLSIWLRIRFKKKCEGLVSTMFRQQAAKYPCEPSGGTLVCFIRGVKGLMDTCHTPRSCLDVKFLGAHPICVEYLISVNYELNIIKTLELMCRLCDFFFQFKAKSIIKQLIILVLMTI